MMASDGYGGMARSLAFTALHDVSADFRALSMHEGGEAITLFLLDHQKFVDTYSKGKVVAGKTDMLTYAKIWVKSYFHYES
jgi:hypothetical protein